MQVRVVVVGSSNTDLVLTCPRLPVPGETLLGGAFTQHRGGKGANQAVAAARAGAQVTFVGARGRDAFGRTAAESLRQEGIDLRHFCVHASAPSGVALILVGGKSRENLIAVARSANDALTRAHVKAARAAIRRAGAVVAQLETPLDAVLAAAELAQEAGVPFILNPAPARRLPRKLLRLVHTLTPNEHEAQLLTGERDVRRSGRKLLRAGCGQVVLTLGARGALLVTRAGERHLPAPHVRVVDTVGAGDCFTGWLAAGIAEGLATDAAVERAVRAATLSVTRPGAQASMPSRREVLSS
jgi:ribokinase